MKYLEAFFSTEKIIYPVLGALISGILLFTVAYLLNKGLEQWFLIAFMVFGFLLGNHFKITQLQSKQSEMKKNKIHTSKKVKNKK